MSDSLNPTPPDAAVESLTPHTGATLSQAITVVDSDGASDTDSARGQSASADTDDQDGWSAGSASVGDSGKDEDDIDIVTQLVTASPSQSPAATTQVAVAAAPSCATLPVHHPFTSGVAYYEVPTSELQPQSDSVTSTRWYVVTRGRFVGVFPHAFMANDAVMHVPNAARERRNNLLTALDLFNAALRHGHVAVVP